MRRHAARAASRVGPAGGWAWWEPWAAVPILAGLWLGACTFDASSLGPGSGAAGDSSTAELGTSTGAGSGHAEGAASGGATDGASGASSSAGPPGEGDDTTDGPPVDACNPPPLVTFEIDVTPTLTAAPMQLGNSATEGTYAYSEVAGQGQASFQFIVPCQAEFRAWARVYDSGVGAEGLDVTEPDSFLVAFDGEGTTEWLYGSCQTLDAALAGSVWSWERVMDSGALCANDELVRTLSPGTHLLHLINREAGDYAQGDVAAVARVVVTSDPAYAP